MARVASHIERGQEHEEWQERAGRQANSAADASKHWSLLRSTPQPDARVPHTQASKRGHIKYEGTHSVSKVLTSPRPWSMATDNSPRIKFHQCNVYSHTVLSRQRAAPTRSSAAVLDSQVCRAGSTGAIAAHPLAFVSPPSHFAQKPFWEIAQKLK